MEGIIDYAGLFPPAGLDLDKAIRNYAAYRKGEDAWMLSRFIIPVTRLPDLRPYGEELFEPDPPFDFSVLGTGNETIGQFGTQLDAIIAQCKDFHNAHGETVTTDILEIKLPEEAAYSGDSALLSELMNGVARRLGEHAHTPKYVFYETFFDRNWEQEIAALLEAVAMHNRQGGGLGHYRYAGFKLRCGGTEAEMVPPPVQVAFALNRAREEGVAMKCTAGLHHPVRHYSDSVETKMHGFFNVFGGAMLSYAHDLTDSELLEIIEEENWGAFRFREEAFTWNNHAVFSGEISELRKVAMISFGSCSFDEPREDLKDLDLL